MGRLVSRFWDERESSSRPATGADPPSRVFCAYVPHSIAQWMPLIEDPTRRHARAAEDAVTALQGDQGTVSPAEWLLTRAESAASSTIEGVRPSARRLARAEAMLAVGGRPPRGDDGEALRNILATEHALEIGSAARPIAREDICAIHATLMGEVPEAGAIRARQIWIGSGIYSTPLDAVFVPPPPEAVSALLDDLVLAVNQPVASPLAHAAMVHAQFETIHPFADGNGRTGRALIHLMLRRAGMTATHTPPISSSLALRRDAYLQALNGTRPVCDSHDPQRSTGIAAWTSLLADATIEAVAFARRIIDHVAAIQNDWRERIRPTGIRANNAAMRLIDLLPSQPVLNANSAAELLDVNPRTARRSIDLLSNAGILVQRSAGKRNRVFEADAIMGTFTTLARLSPGHTDLNTPSRQAGARPGH